MFLPHFAQRSVITRVKFASKERDNLVGDLIVKLASRAAAIRDPALVGFAGVEERDFKFEALLLWGVWADDWFDKRSDRGYPPPFLLWITCAMR